MQVATESLHSVKAVLMGDVLSKKSDFFNSIKDHYCQNQDKSLLFEDRAIFTFQLRPDCGVKIDLNNYRHERMQSNFNFRGIQLVLIVFNYNDQNSFDNLMSWLTEMRRYVSDQKAAVIIGNGFSNTNAAVTEDQAHAFAQAQGCKLIQVEEGDFESIQNALVSALNELPSLALHPHENLHTLSQKQGADSNVEPDDESCCRCIMF